MEPPIPAPNRQRLAGVYSEIVQGAVSVRWGELGALKPVLREFPGAVGHVLAAEHTEPKHLGRRQVRAEFRIKAPARSDRKPVTVAFLHPVVDRDDPASHRYYLSVWRQMVILQALRKWL